MEIKRTFDIVDNLVENLQRDDALAVKRNGKWEKFTTLQYKEFVDNFSYGLLASGFKKGDKIVTISNNRPEWNFIDAGMTQVGLVHVISTCNTITLSFLLYEGCPHPDRQTKEINCNKSS